MSQLRFSLDSTKIQLTERNSCFCTQRLTIQWNKVATNAVNLQKAADSGANMASEKISKEITTQTKALIELKQICKLSGVVVDEKNELEELKSVKDAGQVVKVQTKIVHEIKTKMMMIKSEFDRKLLTKDKEIAILRKTASEIENEKQHLEKLINMKPIVQELSRDSSTVGMK